MKIVASNRKFGFNYIALESLEAGIALEGSEVKSTRISGFNIAEAHVCFKDGEAWLLNAYIARYGRASDLRSYDPYRPKKLLLRKKQIKKLIGKAEMPGLTVVPVSAYFNDKGRLKLKISLAKGKKEYDKRQTIKEREWQRQKGREYKF